MKENVPDYEHQTVHISSPCPFADVKPAKEPKHDCGAIYLLRSLGCSRGFTRLVKAAWIRGA